MDSNSKIPDVIISSLFINDKTKKNSKELETYLIAKISDKNKETLKSTLENYITDLFELNPEYKNNIMHGDITPILAMSDAIQKFDPGQNLYFILFKPIFDLYKTNLDPNLIKNFTNKITNYFTNKTKLVLFNFNELFEILILLKISQDPEVKNSGIALDKLLKESLQNYSDNIFIYKDDFDFDSFCEKICEKLDLKQNIMMSLLVNWIGTICKIRKIGVVKFFQNILPRIFRIQIDATKDLIKHAENTLKIIKINIGENFTRYYKYDKKSMEEILSIIIKEASPKSNKINLSAWEILNLFMEKSERHLDLYLKKTKKYSNNNINNSNNSESSNIMEIKQSATIKPSNIKSNILFDTEKKSNNIFNNNINNDTEKKNNNKLEKNSTITKNGSFYDFNNSSNKQTFMIELNKFNNFTSEEDILEYIPFSLFNKILILITEAYSHDIENQEPVNKLNETIKRIIDKSPKEIKNYGFNPIDITNIILIGMKSPVNKNKKGFFEWCSILYNKYEKDIFKDFKVFIKEYIQAIPQNNPNIFMDMVKFISNIKIEGDIINIIVQNLIEKLMKEHELMSNESYIILLIEHLTKNYSLPLIFESFADALKDIKNFSFASKMIHYLNLYLIVYPMATNFKKSLINNGTQKNNELFLKMYNIWSINSISLLNFCIITEHFELAYNIILNLVKVQLENDYYIHLGELVQLLESELYYYIRIRLLEPSNNIYLIRTLYGILMLLPQGQAFNVLSNRMKNVPTLLVLENGFDNIKQENSNKEEIKKFIDIFLNKQKIKREDEEKRNKNRLKK